MRLGKAIASAAAVCVVAGLALATHAIDALAGSPPASADKPVRGGTVVIAVGTDATTLLPYNSGATVNSDAMSLLFMQHKAITRMAREIEGLRKKEV